jgi:uncharacterized membrane protein (UPF0127 family)
MLTFVRHHAAVIVLVVAALVLAGPVLAQSPARDWMGMATQPEQLPTPMASAACQGDAPYAVVQTDGQPRLSLELASTPAARELGLMYRQSLDPNSGMLFVYSAPSMESYWMHDTLIPLSIAWIDHNGAIVDIQDMQPETDDTHTPAGPYWYALETNLGWFQTHGVGVGQIVQLCLGATGGA